MISASTVRASVRARDPVRAMTSRCSKTGCTSRLMSSGMTKLRPSTIASACVARNSATVPRGLMPSSISGCFRVRLTRSNHVVDDRFIDVNLPALVLKEETLRPASSTGCDGAVIVAVRKAFQDFLLSRGIGIADFDPHQESVELRFRQRIRSVVLDRILRRQNHERAGKRVGDILDRHLVFVHRFEQRALGFRRRPIDLVGENDVREDRARA